MAKKLKLGNAILCEYVGMGSNNKHVLLNVFSGDIIVLKFPADIMIGVYIEVHRDSPPQDKFEFEIRINGDAIIRGDVVMSGSNPLSVVTIPQIPLHVDDDSVIEVVVMSAGYSKAVAISKKIYKGEVSGRAIT
jgi:cephalosporin hydroxylase